VQSLEPVVYLWGKSVYMEQSNHNASAIVADIGGTFARLCRVNLDNLKRDKTEIYPCAEFSSLESVLIHYRQQHSLQAIHQMAIAIACPVLDDLVSMTNCKWQFSIRKLKQQLSLSELLVVNDFSAIAMCIPQLKMQDIWQVGEGQSQRNETRVVVGPGTGLGVAYLKQVEHVYKACGGAGGHTRWAASTEQEWFIYNYLTKLYGHVSHERLLSGYGLENLYQAIALFQGHNVPALKAAEIIPLALSNENPIALATVMQFLVSLGVFAGDLALSFSAFGGVYIAGGIMPRLLPLLNSSDFRRSFEEKGRFKEFNARIPTYVITAEQPGLIGAAVYLQQSVRGEIDAVF